MKTKRVDTAQGSGAVVRPGQGARKVCFFSFVAAFVVLLVACKSPQVAPTPPPADAPTYQQLASVHNERVAKLQKFYADGVIELRWRDEKGKHFEQGNLEIWIQQPRNTALRVEKIGDVFLWLGSDEHQYWLFDLLRQEKVLHLGRHDEQESLDGALSVKPLTLLELMGIARIPQEDDEATVEFATKHNAWAVVTKGAAGPVRMFFDRQSLLPTRIESLQPNSTEVALSSTLQRYESVTQSGMSVLAFPKLAELIDITIAEPVAGTSTQFSGEVKIAIDRATGVVDEGTLQRVFDLERLIQALQPNRVVRGSDQ